jgi:homoaconitase
LNKNLELVKRILDQRPLTLAEKIVYSHLTNPEETVPVRGETYLKLSPDRVAMQGKPFCQKRRTAGNMS